MTHTRTQLVSRSNPTFIVIPVGKMKNTKYLVTSLHPPENICREITINYETSIFFLFTFLQLPYGTDNRRRCKTKCIFQQKLIQLSPLFYPADRRGPCPARPCGGFGLVVSTNFDTTMLSRQPSGTSICQTFAFADQGKRQKKNISRKIYSILLQLRPFHLFVFSRF